MNKQTIAWRKKFLLAIKDQMKSEAMTDGIMDDVEILAGSPPGKDRVKSIDELDDAFIFFEEAMGRAIDKIKLEDVWDDMKDK